MRQRLVEILAAVRMADQERVRQIDITLPVLAPSS